MKIIEEEIMDHIIQDYKSGLSPDKLSLKYNDYSPYTIRENLKIKNVFITKYFSDKELELIKSDFINGSSLKDLSKKYNRPEETIRKKLQLFGLYNTKEQFPYTNKEINVLKEYYPIGDWDSLKLLLPNRNKQSICSKASQLGIKQENWNWTEERILKIMQQKGFVLISSFTNIKDKHDFRDKEGYFYNTDLANILYADSSPLKFSATNIYTIDNIKLYIKLHSIECELLSEKYSNNIEKLKWKCSCGNIFLCSWTDFYGGKHQCNDCAEKISHDKNSFDINTVKELIKDKPYKMIDETFTTLSNGFVAITDDGYKVLIDRFNVFNNRSPEIFHVLNPFTIENIKNYTKINNIATSLLSTEYKGNSKVLEWECGCGKKFHRNWNGFLRGAILCKDCSSIEKYKSQKESEFRDVKEYFKNKGYTLISDKYIDSNAKLRYICEKHKDKGTQTITWSHCKHRNGGCKYCASENNGLLKRLPEDDIRKITEDKGFIYDHVEYSSNDNHKTLIYYICPHHKENGIQTKTLQDMKKSTGKCNYCLGKSRTNSDFIEMMKVINPNIKILSEYINTSNDILCRCKIDGYEWVSNGNRLLNGAGCKQCGIKMQSISSTKSHEQFENEIREKYKDKISLLSKYTGSHDKIKCKCNIHKNIWETTSTSLLTNSIGCPICVGEKTSERCRKSNEQFLEELSYINPNIIPLEPYKSNYKKIKCLCKIHNHIWYASPDKILIRQTGCPKCASYHNENVIDNILDNWGYKYTIQKRFKDCRDKNTLPFDRYLDDFNILIEYDGEGHYKPIRRGSMTMQEAEDNFKKIKYHDSIKDNYCKNNKIPLIRIPYWENDNIEYFLFDKLVKYKAIELVI